MDAGPDDGPDAHHLQGILDFGSVPGRVLLNLPVINMSGYGQDAHGSAGRASYTHAGQQSANADARGTTEYRTHVKSCPSPRSQAGGSQGCYGQMVLLVQCMWALGFPPCSGTAAEVLGAN